MYFNVVFSTARKRSGRCYAVRYARKVISENSEVFSPAEGGVKCTLVFVYFFQPNALALLGEISLQRKSDFMSAPSVVVFVRLVRSAFLCFEEKTRSSKENSLRGNRGESAAKQFVCHRF